LRYPADFQIAQLQQNPAANAVLENHLPAAVLQNQFVSVLTLGKLLKLTEVTLDQVQAVQAELKSIPVERLSGNVSMVARSRVNRSLPPI